MEVAFFPGSDPASFTHQPWHSLPRHQQSLDKTSFGHSWIFLRTQTMNPACCRHLLSTSHFKEGDSTILATRNSSVHPSS